MLKIIIYKKVFGIKTIGKKVTQDLQNNCNSIISAKKLLKHVRISQQEQRGPLFEKPYLTRE